MTCSLSRVLSAIHLFSYRLHRQDCVHSESKLWLIFEWVDQDLKKYMNSCKNDLEPMLVKVSPVKHKSGVLQGIIFGKEG